MMKFFLLSTKNYSTYFIILLIPFQSNEWSMLSRWGGCSCLDHRRWRICAFLIFYHIYISEYYIYFHNILLFNSYHYYWMKYTFCFGILLHDMHSIIVLFWGVFIFAGIYFHERRKKYIIWTEFHERPPKLWSWERGEDIFIANFSFFWPNFKSNLWKLPK